MTTVEFVYAFWRKYWPELLFGPAVVLGILGVIAMAIGFFEMWQWLQ